MNFQRGTDHGSRGGSLPDVSWWTKTQRGGLLDCSAGSEKEEKRSYLCLACEAGGCSHEVRRRRSEIGGGRGLEQGKRQLNESAYNQQAMMGGTLHSCQGGGYFRSFAGVRSGGNCQHGRSSMGKMWENRTQQMREQNGIRQELKLVTSERSCPPSQLTERRRTIELRRAEGRKGAVKKPFALLIYIASPPLS